MGIPTPKPMPSHERSPKHVDDTTQSLSNASDGVRATLSPDVQSDSDSASVLVTQARQDVQGVLGEFPDMHVERRTHELLGDAFLRLRNVRSALGEYEKASALGATLHERTWLALADAFCATADYDLALQALSHADRFDRLPEIALQAFTSGQVNTAIAAWERCNRHGLPLHETAVRALAAYGRRVGDTLILKSAYDLMRQEVPAADYIAAADALIARHRKPARDDPSWSDDLLHAIDAYARAGATDRLVALLDGFHDFSTRSHPHRFVDVVNHLVERILDSGLPMPAEQLTALADVFLARGTSTNEKVARNIYALIATSEQLK
jgi:tetratricopeptide (TPR) repeat protein